MPALHDARTDQDNRGHDFEAANLSASPGGDSPDVDTLSLSGDGPGEGPSWRPEDRPHSPDPAQRAGVLRDRTERQRLRLRVEAEAEEALQFAFSHFFIVAWSARSTETTHSSPMRRASAA